MLKHQNAASALAGGKRTHQTRGARAYNQDICFHLKNILGKASFKGKTYL